MGISALPSALRRAGFVVGAAGAKNGPLAHTRHVSRGWFTAETIDTPQKLLHVVSTAFERFAPEIIFPADDQTVRIFHHAARGHPTLRVSTALRDVLQNSLGDPAFQDITAAKSRLETICSACGVNMPPQLVAPDDEQARAFAQTHGFPLLIKPDTGWAGQGIEWCRTADDMIKALHTARSRRGAFALQKFIRGQTAAIACSALRGQWLAGIAYAKHRTVSPHGPTSVARRLDRADMLDAGARLVRHFGYTGFAGIDFVIEESTNKAWMIEFNPRVTPICGRAHWMGVDLAAALYTALTSKPPATPLPTIRTEFLAFFPQEWLRNPQSKFLSSAHHDVPWDDPRLLRYFIERHTPAAKGSIAAPTRVDADGSGQESVDQRD
jgi:hypothetical protein